MKNDKAHMVLPICIGHIFQFPRYLRDMKIMYINAFTYDISAFTLICDGRRICKNIIEKLKQTKSLQERVYEVSVSARDHYDIMIWMQRFYNFIHFFDKNSIFISESIFKLLLCYSNLIDTGYYLV